MARTFLDAHNATRSHRHSKRSRTASRGRSRGSECSSLDFEFETLSSSFSLFLASSSLQFHLALRVAGLAAGDRPARRRRRAAPGCCEAVQSEKRLLDGNPLHDLAGRPQRAPRIRGTGRKIHSRRISRERALTMGTLFYRSLPLRRSRLREIRSSDY